MQFTPTQKTSAAWIAILASLAFVLWLLAPVLSPFLVAAVFAYILAPVVNSLHARHWLRLPRLALVVLVEVLFLLFLLGVMLLIVPILLKEIPALREQLPVLAERVNATLSPWLAQFGVQMTMDVASIKAFVVKYLNANFEDVFGSLMASVKLGGSVALAVIGNAVLIPVALFYLLADWDRLVAGALTWVPPRLRGPYDRFIKEADGVLGQYLRGQLMVMLSLALYYTVTLALFGLDLALPIGGVHGFGNFCTLCWFRPGPGAGFARRVASICLDQGLGDGGCGVWTGAVDRELAADAAHGGRAYWIAPAGRHLWLAGFWPIARLRRHPHRLACQCGPARGGATFARQLFRVRPVPPLRCWRQVAYETDRA